MRSEVSSDWLQSYIKAMRSVLEIFKDNFQAAFVHCLPSRLHRVHGWEDCCLQSLTSALQTSLTVHCYITVQVIIIVCFPANNRTHAFTLSGNTQGQNAVSSGTGTLGGNACNADWLIIPCASNIGRTGLPTCVDRICGGTFNTEISTTPATIISKDGTHKTNVPGISNWQERNLKLYLLNSVFKRASFPVLILSPLNRYAYKFFLNWEFCSCK